MPVIVIIGFAGTMVCMRNSAPDVTDLDVAEQLLTTGEAARLLNSSRQHVADLCDRGLLPFLTVGTHRRVRRGDVEALRTRTDRMTRDQERSLWLAYAIAGRIVTDPERALALGRQNIHTMHENARGSTTRWLDEWTTLLAGPIGQLLDAYTSRSPRGRELRQNAPFAGLLTDDERAEALAAWKRSS